ncbi:MAG: phosphotransferase [Aliidiomarina sp.]|uniref:aminoglycoside phosphotransferase family protein n=1 Tax=Aliidiomarina sp. TaxID=1872439 RepID=UPI0025C4EEF5|nr:phosphotransferase [Aliidiomarina sp.]MCH8502412.1 phosphotransferase [Aliidiomarina sp.]
MDQRLQFLQPWLQQQLQRLLPQSTFDVESLAGDASFRRYFRVVVSSAGARQTMVLVDAPPPESLQPFIALAHAYQQRGVRTPEVLAFDESLGVMLLEDFGDTLFASGLNKTVASSRYRAAIDLLPQIMQVTEHTEGSVPDYDVALLTRENSLFHDWLLKTHLGMELSPAESKLWQRVNQLLIDNARVQPQVGVHRDYHSRNLMLLDGAAEAGELGVIDFQDAVQGAITYDLVSLLRDCYVVWPDDFVQEQLHYAYQRFTAAGLLTDVDFSQWQRWFDWMGLQRHTKASGIFARLYHRDGKAGYLHDIPRTVEYLVTVSRQYPELHDYCQWLQERVQPALAEKAQQRDSIGVS